jgi:hypothetical protein
MTIVKGDFFIVPNPLTNLTETDSYLFESFRNALSRSAQIFGVEGGQRFAQIWYASPECENWGSHRWPDHPEFFGSQGIPGWIPTEVLLPLKEGDTLNFQFNGKTVQVTACQLRFRYRDWGPFEKALKGLLER